MYKFKIWVSNFRGKIIISIVITFVLSFSLVLPLSLNITQIKDPEINTYAYTRENNEGINQAVYSVLEIDNSQEYEYNVENITTKKMLINLNEEDNAIGYVPVDPFLIDDDEVINIFKDNLDKINFRPLYLIDNEAYYDEYYLKYSAFQTYNIFFAVDKEEAILLSNNLFINNPNSILWTYSNDGELEILENNYNEYFNDKTDQEMVELELNFMFYNWLLSSLYSYRIMYENFNNRENVNMNYFNFKSFVELTKLNDYPDPIMLNIAGPKEASYLVNELIYNEIFGFNSLCNELGIDIILNYIEISNSQVLEDSGDYYLRIQTRGMYDNEIDDDFQYGEIEVNKNNFYPIWDENWSNNNILYYTFYVRPIVFLINKDFKYVNSDGEMVSPKWITTEGLNMIYTRDFSFDELIKYNEMG